MERQLLFNVILLYRNSHKENFFSTARKSGKIILITLFRAVVKFCSTNRLFKNFFCGKVKNFLDWCRTQLTGTVAEHSVSFSSKLEAVLRCICAGKLLALSAHSKLVVVLRQNSAKYVEKRLYGKGEISNLFDLSRIL